MDEQKVTDLKSAAVLADDCALTHKKSGSPTTSHILSNHIGQVTIVNPKQNPVMRTKGHLQKLQVTNLTKVKLNKGFLSSRKDQCVFIARNLDI